MPFERALEQTINDVTELVLHIHPLAEFFCGAASDPDTKTPFQLTAGNDELLATMTEIMDPAGSSPFGRAEYNGNELLVTAANAAVPWRIRFAYGTSAANALTNEGNGLYSELMIVPSAAPTNATPLFLHMRDGVYGVDGLYARAWAFGRNGSTIDFFLQIHEQ